MTDQSKAQDILRKRSLLQQQRLNRQSEPQPQPDIQPLYYVAREAGSGRAVLRSRSGDLTRGEIITNAQIQPGQRVLSAGETINQITAPYQQPQPRRRRSEVFKLGSMVYLIEEIYESTETISSSCESEIKLSAAFVRRRKAANCLAILYEKTQDNDPVECTCPTYNRLGNRCYPVCDGTGQYNTLQECLAAPQPPWPNPDGEDNRGGYLLVWTGHKIGLPGGAGGSPWIYPDGAWSPGNFYQNLAHPCKKTGFDLIDYLVSSSWYNNNPGEFPAGNTIGIWTYIYVPAAPKLDPSLYSPNAFIAGFKGTGSTSGRKYATANGWLAYEGYNMDVWITEEQRWYSGNMAFAECYVAKYFPVNQLQGEIPTPPATIGLINTAGVSLIHNPSQIVCSPFNDPDTTCNDPGRNNPPRECPFPKDRRSRTFYLGGSKQELQLNKIHYTEPYFAYLIATEANFTEQEGEIKTKELIQMLHGKNKDGTWCAISTIKTNDRAITKIISRNPNLPAIDSADWKRSLLGYQSIFPNAAPSSGQSFIDNYRLSTNKNIISVTSQPQNLNFLVDFDLQQKVRLAESPNVFEPVLEAIKNRDLNTVRLCISPVEGNYANQSKEKGFVLDKVFKLPVSGINIIGYSGWVARIEKTHKLSTLDCKALQANVVCNSNWANQSTLCSKGTGKVLHFTSFQSGKTYTIKVVRGANFPSGNIQVWGCYPENVSPANRTFLENMTANESEILINLSNYSGLLFQQREPINNRWKTLCISWDNESQTVTLEAFR